MSMGNKEIAISIENQIADDVEYIMTTKFPFKLSDEKSWMKIMRALDEAELRGRRMQRDIDAGIREPYRNTIFGANFLLFAVRIDHTTRAPQATLPDL